MRKFNFRLQSVLKLKEFNESKKKVELGQVNQKRKKIEDKIEQCYQNIKTAKDEENNILSSAVNADFLPFYPRYIKSQKNNIKNLQEDLELVVEEYHEKLNELNKARGEVKVFDKLKENALIKYKRDLRRKEILENEEMVNIKRSRESQI